MERSEKMERGSVEDETCRGGKGSAVGREARETGKGRIALSIDRVGGVSWSK